MSKSKINDRIVVVDLECTCWEETDPAARRDKMEIIQIGVAEIDVPTLEITNRASYLVQPQESEITAYCTALTRLTPELIDAEGESLEMAMDRMRRNHSTRRRAWASYGDFDRIQFQRECERKGLGYPFGRRHFNVKTLFALMHGLERELGMDDTLKIAGLELEGHHHDGYDDAYNIAKLLVGLFHPLRNAREGMKNV